MVTITCPRCGSVYDMGEDFTGGRTECGECGHKWAAVPDGAIEVVEAQEVVEAERVDDLIACPCCGEKIKAVALKCRFCGEKLDGLGNSIAQLEASKPPQKGKVKFRRETSCGMMCGEAIAILMIIFGVCLCITVIGVPFGIILILIGGALAVLFSRIKSWYECSVCGEKLSTKNVKICPFCGAIFRK